MRMRYLKRSLRGVNQDRALFSRRSSSLTVLVHATEHKEHQQDEDDQKRDNPAYDDSYFHQQISFHFRISQTTDSTYSNKRNKTVVYSDAQRSGEKNPLRSTAYSRRGILYYLSCKGVC
jgi:hypothetical protein